MEITVPVNGPACVRMTSPLPAPTELGLPICQTETELCQHVLSAIQAYDAAPEETLCRRINHISDDATLFEAGGQGDSTYFLAQKLPGGWRFIAELGTVFGGRGNASGWLDAIRASPGTIAQADEVLFDYRIVQTDWDVGSHTYSEQTSCQRLRCVQAEGGLLVCDRAVVLVERGGHYVVEPGPSGAGNWPYKVGAPTEQWDCRAP